MLEVGELLDRKFQQIAKVVKYLLSETQQLRERVERLELHAVEPANEAVGTVGESLPLNKLLPTEGGFFIVHWICDNHKSDVYNSSDSCYQCGKNRPGSDE